MGLNSNIVNWIQIKLDLNWFFFKWDENWCTRYWKHACDYDVEFVFMKIHRFEFTHFHFSLIENQLNKFEFEIIVQKDDLWNLKLFLHKPILMN